LAEKSTILIACDSFWALADQGLCPQVAGKKIRWIVPHALGGGYDTYSRLIEPFLEKTLGTEIVVENILGAGGIIGATTLKEAKPDGRTVGILNGSGLMVVVIAGEKNAPNPAKNFTILGRIARSKHVFVTGNHSPFKTIEDVLKEAKKRPIVFGTRDVGSTSFISCVTTSHILGINPEIVPGYSGSRAGTLAVIRGDVDLVSVNFESILKQIDSGDIRPLLQVSDEPISSHYSLKDTPLLGGDKGLAAQRANEFGQDVEQIKADAKALAALIGAGRLIVAPSGMDQSLSNCLEKALYMTLSSAEFNKAAAAANRFPDIARGKIAHRDLLVVQKNVHKFIPLIQQAIQKVRK
jgi:tripartite-type tricarboxylate transporter receptor subunit TctC